MGDLHGEAAVAIRVAEENQVAVDEPKPKKTKILEEILNPYPWSPWSKIFLISCVIGVANDSFFLYIPILDEDKKCIKMDEKMKAFALCVRTVTDMTYVLHFMVRIRSAFAMAKETSILDVLPWFYILIDILAILPIPQVVVIGFFSNLAGLRSLKARRLLNYVILFGYVPRFLRIYFSAMDVGRTFGSLSRRVWVRGAFNFCLYILGGHVYGALYYLYSIFRETECWYHACKIEAGCFTGTTFDCDKYASIPSRNLTLLNEKCPVNPPNADVYDFGIFANAIGANIFGAADFPIKKLIHCFWWGLRNMSSLGQNLETSGFPWENSFSIFISLSGLLIILYLIGNLQVYMQLETTRADETRKKMNIKEQEIRSYVSNYKLPKHEMKIVMRLLHGIIEGEDEGCYQKLKYLLSLLEESKKGHDQPHMTESFIKWVTNIIDAKKLEKKALERSAELWISKNNISGELKKKIMLYVRLRLQQGNDVDIGNLLPVLPLSHRISVKKHLCWDTLKKVPMLENVDTKVYETICDHARPRIYQENTYIIRKGEPIGLMLFFTDGIVWSFAETNNLERLERGDYYGDEVLEWRLKSTSYSDFPMSSRNIMSQTKVEALALTATDLDCVLSKCWSKFTLSTPLVLEGLTPFAIRSIRELRCRRNCV